METKIIGVAGVATSGKDTFARIAREILLKKQKNVQIFHFADALKTDISDFIRDKIGKNIFELSGTEKEKIRPFMVWYGCYMRDVDPLYWVKKVEELIIASSPHYAIIPDVRFENELDWVSKNGGSVIHIQRQTDTDQLVLPSNAEEEKNDPIVKRKADYNLKWKTLPIEQLYSYVERTISNV